MVRHGQEVKGSVARTCRYYGVSRHTYYKWLRRYEEDGGAMGAEALGQLGPGFEFPGGSYFDA
jgi:transposase-like protein